jgi:mannitol-1-phosphate/altronate dehydrogenase
VNNQSTVKRLVLFGAGMTGRGQVAQLAYDDGWEISLVDKDQPLIDRLRSAGQYTVQLLSKNTREVTIRGFNVYHTSETEAIHLAIRQADLVVTSVLEPNLPDVAKVLAPALIARVDAGCDQPLNIIAAENMGDSTSRLRSYVWQNLPEAFQQQIDTTVGFPNSMVSRVVPIADNPL